MAMTVGPGGNPYGVGGAGGSGRTGGLQSKLDDPGKTVVEPSVKVYIRSDGTKAFHVTDDGDPNYYELMKDPQGKWVVVREIRAGEEIILPPGS